MDTLKLRLWHRVRTAGATIGARQPARYDRSHRAVASAAGATALQGGSERQSLGKPGVRCEERQRGPGGGGYRGHPAVEQPGRWRHLPRARRTGNMYPDVSLFIDGAWTEAAAGRTHRRGQPRHRRGDRHRGHADSADLDRALEAADEGLPDLAQGVRLRPLQGHAQGGRHPARARRRHRPLLTHGTGQAAGRGQGRGRWPAPTSSTGSPRKPAAPMAASSRRAPRASISW